MTESVFWLAVNLYHEGRGEPEEGQRAICHVVLNRAAKRGMSVKDVVLQPYQFSWHNGNKFPPIGEYHALLNCLDIAEDIELDRQEGIDPVRGADHYFADYIEPPEWSKDMTEICKIGRHTFFRG